MRRGLALTAVWALGIVLAVTLAFAAVGRVASGVAPHDVARLSQTAIDKELSETTRPSAVSTSSSRAPSVSTAPQASTTATTPQTDNTVAPPITSSSPSSNAPPPTTVTTTVSAGAPHNTVTTAQGGTLFTRCTGPETIEFVAAVPRTGYERTVDKENSSGIEQSFVNIQHKSTIAAECSNGVVNAHVEEESADD